MMPTMASTERAVIASPSDADAFRFSDEELVRSPAVLSGFATNVHGWGMRSYAQHIEELGQTLKVPSMVQSFACVLVQRYMMLESVSGLESSETLATAAFFLACKAQETPKRLKEVVTESLRLRLQNDKLLPDLFPSDSRGQCLYDLILASSESGAASPLASPSDGDFFVPPHVFRNERDAVLNLEEAILRAVSFCLHIEMPYKPFMELVTRFVPDETKKVFVQVGWSFINDSYKTWVHMKYDEKSIAIAAFMLTRLFLSQGSPGSEAQNSPSVSLEFEELENKQVMDAAFMMLELYDDSSKQAWI
ncbi:Cyclin-T1-5 [Porphyridium purpureum]|uniref:Cyclin-T1-5 n=1 Tax=Porphyridium purpureum TaxID=35688 RepID=A0A5J4Z7T9_PORPP|nr:Cyclin-T1-5 [Porphyridium purpureum]|eukprot:POR1648..scf295_1